MVLTCIVFCIGRFRSWVFVLNLVVSCNVLWICGFVCLVACILVILLDVLCVVLCVCRLYVCFL